MHSKRDPSYDSTCSPSPLVASHFRFQWYLLLPKGRTVLTRAAAKALAKATTGAQNDRRY